jgi:hypothetical protein
VLAAGRPFEVDRPRTRFDPEGLECIAQGVVEGVADQRGPFLIWCREGSTRPCRAQKALTAA